MSKAIAGAPAGSELFLTVLKPRPSVDTTNAAESGILFNQAIHPYQVIPVLTQVQEAKEPEREYWIYDLKTQRQRRATESEVGTWKPWNSRSASDPNSALAKYHIRDAAPSPDGSKVAYIYGVDNPAQSKTWAARLLVSSDHDHQLLEVTPDAHRVEQFWWTADGSALYFTQHDGRGHSAELWELRSGDLKPELVYTADAGEYLSSFSSDNAGKVFACVRENNATPPQIAVIDAVTKPVRTIVDLNPGFSLLQKGTYGALGRKQFLRRKLVCISGQTARFRTRDEVSADRDHVSQRRLFSAGSIRRRESHPSVCRAWLRGLMRRRGMDAQSSNRRF